MNEVTVKHLFSFFGLCAFALLALGSIDSGSNSPGINSAQRGETEREKSPAVVDSNWKRDGDLLYVVGTVKNPSNKQYRYVQVEINLYDKSGAQVGSTMANVNNLEPYGTWKFKAIVLEDNARRYEIKGVTGF